MKLFNSKYFWIMTSVMSLVGYWVSCTKDNQVLDIETNGSNELVSLKTATAPTIDGIVDASWNNAQKLVTTVTVPDPGNDYFKGYVGDAYSVTMRSMYDANKIYFLAEWHDGTKSLNRDPWYFDPVTKRWAEENRKPTFDNTGNKIREAFYEDKFAVLWNIDNSVTEFNNVGCYASCHTSLDPLTHGGATGRHYTGSATQFIDMWHWKSVRTGMPFPVGKVDDQLQNNTEFDLVDGGRHSDPKTAGGYADNVQTLPLTGGTPGQTVTVPKYVIPGRANYYWILKDEQTNGTAKLITGVDVNGILYYSGGSVDPNADIEFQRNGATTGAKCIPSVCDIGLIVGDRGDIDAVGIYTGNGWILEFSRTLTTTSGVAGKTDVQFDITNNYVFGIGVFENAAIAHAINSKLILKFQK